MIKKHSLVRLVCALVCGVIGVLIITSLANRNTDKALAGAHSMVSREAILPAAHYDTKRSIRYAFTVNNPTSTPKENITFSTYAPIALSSNQQCCDSVSVSSPHVMDADAFDNQVLTANLGTLAPFSSRIVKVRAALKLASEPNVVDTSNIERYLQSEPLAPANNPSIMQLASALKKPSDKATVQSIYDWLVANVRYSGYDPQDRGATFAIDHRRGDCTEFMYLFIALSRANGIPARGIAGYVYDKDTKLQPADHHNWAEVYLDGAWHIADAQKQILMDNYELFIALKVLEPNRETSVSNAHRFWTNTPDLVVQMN